MEGSGEVSRTRGSGRTGVAGESEEEAEDISPRYG